MTEQGCTECVTIIRPSFKKFLDKDPCRAATFNHLLYWIGRKAKGQPADRVRSGEAYWYGSADDIRNGLDENWSLWKIRKELDELAKTFIGRRHNPIKGFDREYQYFFGEEQGRALREACEKLDICLLHLGLHPDVVHLLKTVNAITENSKCNCRKPQMDLVKTVDAFTENSRAIPKDTTKVSSQGLSSKDTDKERESSDVSPTSSPPDGSLTLSSNSHDSSAEGVLQHNVTQQSSGSVASSVMATPFVDTTIPIVTQTGTTPVNEQQSIVSSQGYMNDGGHVGNAQGDSAPQGSEQPDNAALSTAMQQSVIPNDTAEVSGIAQEVLFAPPKRSSKPRTPKESPKKRDLLAEASQEAQAVVQEWVSIFKKPVGINKTLIDNAEELATYQPEPGEIKGCYAWLWKTERDWYSKHGGIHLGTIASKFAGFRSLGDIPDDKSRKRSIDHSDFSQQSLDKEFYPTKAPQNAQKEKQYAF